MSFSYDFDTINDKVHFAYCIPYTYSHLLDLIRELCPLECVKYETAWRSLSGLPVPMLQITDFGAPNYNKKIVLVTARIHPGESNSSHVCEGLMRYLAYEGGQILTKYHFYIVPMLNPDGVVAGNYRTSLFGKDLNRTFNQSRKYAFPQTFHLVEFAKSLKKQHKQKFNIYLDLHGHSVKKNVFFYGPDYSIMHSYYSQSRDFAKILGNVTTMFRYYSCVFRISMEKLTTARATLNRLVNVPFTYTMQSSNGSYFDSSQHVEVPFTSSKWKEMGASLARALGFWNHNAPSSPVKSNRKKFIDEEENKKNQQVLKNPPGEEKMSDDEISEGNSDVQPEDQDLQDEELEKIQLQISGKLGMKEVKEEDESNRVQSPTKTDRISYKKNQEKEVFDWSRDLRKSQVPAKHDKRQKLPPIPMQLNQAQFLVNRSRKKKSLVIEGLKNLSALEANQIKDKQKKTRIEISQLLIGLRSPGLTIEETKSVLKRKTSRQEIIENARKYK